jgi:uncharacterized protein YlxP (DUF503 family)
MIVGYGILDIWIAESRSLKEKRRVLHSILKRTQNNFNVSIAEIGEHDHWKRAKVGFSVVGNDGPYINGKIDHILRFIDDMRLAEVINAKIEITGVSDLTERDSFGLEKYDEF